MLHLFFLQKNIELEHVNLSWNGLAEHGCRAFQEHLPKNHTLKSLDISNNRIGFHTLGHFLIGLKGNDTLKYLKVSDLYYHMPFPYSYLHV